jgi:hypothetical protein
MNVKKLDRSDRELRFKTRFYFYNKFEGKEQGAIIASVKGLYPRRITPGKLHLALFFYYIKYRNQ